jgi:hypothetical protein
MDFGLNSAAKDMAGARLRFPAVGVEEDIMIVEALFM